MNISDKYTEYCRPELGSMLQAIKLDKVYHRGSGNYFYYNDENGNEIKVIDFLGGYGASLFGHSHPSLLKVAMKNLQEQIPFNSQASCRKETALLAEKFDKMLYERTGNHYITALASTGTESVGLAIRHAELSFNKRIDNLHKELNKQIVFFEKELKNGSVKLSSEFYSFAKEKLNLNSNASFKEISTVLKNHNFKVFEEKPYLISLKNSYHGSASINLIFADSDNVKSIDECLETALTKYYWLELNENNKIEFIEKQRVNITGFFIEPIQGEGGINIISKEFLEYSREFASKYNIALIFDEIQCGMGRTGTLLFSEQQGVYADYYLFSKTLGGGLSKISACLIKKELYEPEFDMMNSSTFAEDPYSSSIALEVLNIFDTDKSIMQNCLKMGDYLKSGILEIKNKYPNVIEDVRGIGLMLGIRFNNQKNFGSNAIPMLSSQKLLGYIITGYLLNEHKIRVAPTLESVGTIRLEPSAFITKEDCDILFKALDKLCEIIYKQNIYELTKYIVGLAGINSENIQSFRNEKIKNYIKPKNVKKVAFIGHFINAEHIKMWDIGFSLFTNEQLEEYLEKIYKLIDPQVYEQVTVKSITGDAISLDFIGLCVDSKIISEQMKKNDLNLLHEKIEKAVELAVKNNCLAMGFGGYTSIITKNCQSLLTNSIALTSGNSLTVGMGIEALIRASEEKNINLETACFAAIGAAGNIASIYSEIMSEKVPKIVLIGKDNHQERLYDIASKIYLNAFYDILNNKNLEGIAKAIYKTKTIQDLLKLSAYPEKLAYFIFDNLKNELGEEVPIQITRDLNEIIKANIILSATNSSIPIIFPEMLKEGNIVICDISVPTDTDKSVLKKRDDVEVIKGGVVSLPLNLDFSINGMPLEKGTSFACMAETLLLGLTEITENYSYGRINKSQVKKIMELAKLHGFTLARVKNEASY